MTALLILQQGLFVALITIIVMGGEPRLDSRQIKRFLKEVKGTARSG
jgi:hypothetical protein